MINDIAANEVLFADDCDCEGLSDFSICTSQVSYQMSNPHSILELVKLVNG
jgi:hypothetical protein